MPILDAGKVGLINNAVAKVLNSLAVKKKPIKGVLGTNIFEHSFPRFEIAMAYKAVLEGDPDNADMFADLNGAFKSLATHKNYKVKFTEIASEDPGLIDLHTQASAKKAPKDGLRAHLEAVYNSTLSDAKLKQLVELNPDLVNNLGSADAFVGFSLKGDNRAVFIKNDAVGMGPAEGLYTAAHEFTHLQTFDPNKKALGVYNWKTLARGGSDYAVLFRLDEGFTELFARLIGGQIAGAKPNLQGSGIPTYEYLKNVALQMAVDVDGIRILAAAHFDGKFAELDKAIDTFYKAQTVAEKDRRWSKAFYTEFEKLVASGPGMKENPAKPAAEVLRDRFGVDLAATADATKPATIKHFEEVAQGLLRGISGG